MNSTSIKAKQSKKGSEKSQKELNAKYEKASKEELKKILQQNI